MRGRLYIMLFFPAFVACGDKNMPGSSEVKAGNTGLTQTMVADNQEFATISEPPKAEIKQYAAWLHSKESGVYHKRKVGAIVYEAQYKPLDYVAWRESGMKQRPEEEDLRAKIERIGGLHHFEFRINIDGYNSEFLKYSVSGQDEYDERIKYYSFTMQQDIAIVTEKGDTIPCGIHHFERTYDVAPYAVFQVGFPSEATDLSAGFTLIFNDRMNNNGLVKFYFDGRYIQHIEKHLFL